MRRRWLYEGPNHTVLQDMLSYGERLKDKQHQALLLREPLALAFLLDDVSVVKRLLLSYPQLEQSYPSVLPLARHLASRGFGSTLADKRAEILAFAKLHAELDEGTSSLTALLRDKTRSIAIVGNSAVRTSFPAPREIVSEGDTGAIVTGPVKLAPPFVLVKTTWLITGVAPWHFGSSTVTFSAMT